MRKADFGYFSLARRASDAGDAAYLRWHQLDHMPEQWQLDGIVWGQRWASTPACLETRAAAVGDWAQMQHVTHYLMREPIEATLDDFFGLAQRLRDQGRFAHQAPSLFQGALRLVETYAAPSALVAPEVVPFRPNRGIYLVLEQAADQRGWDTYMRRWHAETMPELLDLPGVAGTWVFTTTPTLVSRAILTPGQYRITLMYLDEEPPVISESIAEPLRRAWAAGASRPLLAGAFESMTTWRWDRF